MPNCSETSGTMVGQDLEVSILAIVMLLLMARLGAQALAEAKFIEFIQFILLNTVASQVVGLAINMTIMGQALPAGFQQPGNPGGNLNLRRYG